MHGSFIKRRYSWYACGIRRSHGNARGAARLYQERFFNDICLDITCLQTYIVGYDNMEDSTRTGAVSFCQGITRCSWGGSTAILPWQSSCKHPSCSTWLRKLNHVDVWHVLKANQPSITIFWKCMIYSQPTTSTKCTGSTTNIGSVLMGELVLLATIISGPIWCLLLWVQRFVKRFKGKYCMKC